MPCEVLTAGLEVPVQNLFRGAIHNPPVADVPSNCVDFDPVDVTLRDKSMRHNSSLWAMCTSARADVKPPLPSTHDSVNAEGSMFVLVPPNLGLLNMLSSDCLRFCEPRHTIRVWCRTGLIF